VIGCGPAGLAAAHAAAGLEYPVRVIAPKQKTPQRGPLLLQRPIPGINKSHPDGYIRQIVIGGGILDYRYKLYGDINIGINGDILEPGYHAWRFPETYDLLWDKYSDLIEDRRVAPWTVSEYANDDPEVLMINTAPANEMCVRRSVHVFRDCPVIVTEPAIYSSQPDDTIIFSGDPEVPWSRSSRIFGTEVTEWPMQAAPDVRERFKPNKVRVVRKPISTNCNCHPGVLRTGRFGTWRNQTWVDTAYYDTRNALISDQRADAWTRVLAGKKID
jgi:hypothetical protein